jgi:hypothetical protein
LSSRDDEPTILGDRDAMTVHGTCPLCGVRKAKRECPALGRTICAVCCGTKRLIEISCPDSCSYLAASRIHPAAVVQRRQERDLQFFLPLVEDLTEPQAGLVLLFQGVLLRHAALAIPAVLDVDVAEGAAAVAATLETARRGLFYEHQPASDPALRLASELRQAIAAMTTEPSIVARLEEDAATALRRIEQGARTAADALAGDEPPVFIGVVRRLMPDPGADRNERVQRPPGVAPDGGPLIIPG